MDHDRGSIPKIYKYLYTIIIHLKRRKVNRKRKKFYYEVDKIEEAIHKDKNREIVKEKDRKDRAKNQL